MYKLLKDEYLKKADGKWELVNQRILSENYTREQWNQYILGASDFFRGLGAIEKRRNDTLTSIAPDRTQKVVYRLGYKNEK